MSASADKKAIMPDCFFVRYCHVTATHTHTHTHTHTQRERERERERFMRKQCHTFQDTHVRTHIQEHTYKDTHIRTHASLCGTVTATHIRTHT